MDKDKWPKAIYIKQIQALNDLRERVGYNWRPWSIFDVVGYNRVLCDHHVVVSDVSLAMGWKVEVDMHNVKGESYLYHDAHIRNIIRIYELCNEVLSMNGAYSWV
jgi:hypothetical protein